MSVIFVLLPIASLLAVFFVVAFIWAVYRGQFDDLTTPAVRILHDDDDVADSDVADSDVADSDALDCDVANDQAVQHDDETNRNREQL